MVFLEIPFLHIYYLKDNLDYRAKKCELFSAKIDYLVSRP